VKTTRSDSWQRFVEDPRAAEHGVQVYEDDSELAEAVGRYLAAGFRAGAPAVVIATAEHGARFAEALEAEGLDPAALAAQGQLTVRDSHETLATLMEGDAPSPLRFERIIGGVIDEVSARFPDETIRAFGDMVDVLSERGQREAALALEELWNGLARTRRFALFCSYRLDIFDLEVQALTLPSVFEAHSVARPSVDPARLAAAVDRAVAEVAGARELARIYLTVAEHAPRGGLPRAQALLGCSPGSARAIPGSRACARARAPPLQADAGNAALVGRAAVTGLRGPAAEPPSQGGQRRRTNWTIGPMCRRRRCLPSGDGLERSSAGATTPDP
jgi:MEDS: MEthanogen/methylotroph, DcmR Sensory domain